MDIGARPVAAPDIARIDRHLGLRRRRPTRRLGRAEMHDANPRACRQTACSLGGTKWIFYLAQMADHGHVEAAGALGAAAAYRERRLTYDVNFIAKPCRHTPARELLQRD